MHKRIGPVNDFAPVAGLSGFAPIIDEFDAFIIDQWGVVHDGNEPYPGVLELLSYLARRGKPVIILTNSSKTAEVNRLRLERRFGVPRSAYTEVVSSAQVMKDLMEHRLGAPWQELGRFVFLLAEPEDRNLLAGLDFECVEEPSRAELVVMLSVPEGSRRVDQNRSWIDGLSSRGAPLICPSADTFSVSRSGVDAGMGALADAYLRRGGKVVNVGKPEPLVYEECRRLIGVVPPDRVLAVGDQLYSDVEGAARQGFRTVLVGSGAGRLYSMIDPAATGWHGRTDLRRQDHDTKPTWVIPSLRL